MSHPSLKPLYVSWQQTACQKLNLISKHFKNISRSKLLTKMLHFLRARYTILCIRRLQSPRDDCAVQVQWFTSVYLYILSKIQSYMKGKKHSAAIFSQFGITKANKQCIELPQNYYRDFPKYHTLQLSLNSGKLV